MALDLEPLRRAAQTTATADDGEAFVRASQELARAWWKDKRAFPSLDPRNVAVFLIPLLDEIARLTTALHRYLVHPDFEYATTTNGRKDGMNAPPPGDGWEPNIDYHGGFERFDYHEENYWRRLGGDSTVSTEDASASDGGTS